MDPFEVTVSGHRITGPGTDVTFTRPLMMLVTGWGLRSLEVRGPGEPVIP